MDVPSDRGDSGASRPRCEMTTLPELRLALAMRGGVSLAVWMGGACSEIDRLRRALDEPEEPRSATYRALLQDSGYGSVAVDVVAGASAGGLNSVLMACSVVHGMRFDGRIRDLWLHLGDLGALTRSAGLRPPVSLLDGDGGFYGPLAPRLDRLVSEATPPEPAPRLEAVLTCTLFTAVPRTRYQDLGSPLVEGRNRAWFRFRNLPDAPSILSDFPPAGAQRAAALRRLAYAARTTSSFPGAFEPARIGFSPGSAPPADEPDLPPTHYGCYSESRPSEGGPDRDLVIDGGVLDNIPVAWAVRSIAAAPADKPVDRWLVYLQPLPFAPPRPAARGLPGLLATTRRARALRGGTEALADDLDQLEQLQQDALRRQGFQQTLEYALGQVPSGEDLPQFLRGLYERALASVPAYRDRAGNLEASRIRALWIDPLPVLGADPLDFSEVTRVPLAGRDPDALLHGLPGDGPELVLDATAAGDGQDALSALLRRFRSPQVLARTVAVLLDAARELGDAGLAHKAELYRLRTEIEVLIAHSDRALAAEPVLSQPVLDPAELVRRAAWRPAEPGDGWPQLRHWDALVQQAQALAGVVAPASAPRAFLGCLVGAAADTGDPAAATAAVLAAVELLTGPSRPDPLAETSAVRFHMLSAQNRSPLAPDEDDGARRVADKLAGNQLSNFGSFLSARWRLNDWTWGRLDAACSLVDIALQRALADSDRLAALCALAGLPPTAGPPQVREALVRRLHEEVLREELPHFEGLGNSPPAEGVDHPPLEGDLGPALAPLTRAGSETVVGLLTADPARLTLFARLLAGGAFALAGTAVGRVAQALQGRGT